MDPPLLTICMLFNSKQKSTPPPTHTHKFNYFQLRTVKKQRGQNHDLEGGGGLLYKISGADSIPIFMSVTGYWLTCGGGGGSIVVLIVVVMSSSETNHLIIKYSIPQTMSITTITLLYLLKFLQPSSQIFRA